MRLYHAIALACTCLLAASACNATTGAQPTGVSAPAATNSSEATEQLFPDFDPGAFSHPTQISSAWLPLKPGTRWVYEGTTVEDDGTVVPHRVEIHVTDLTKIIGGVRSVVTWDLDYSDNQLVEAELAFFAQDDEGNVWRMGEYPEAYEEGKLVEAPTWIHGFAEARAGIMMLANPLPGTPSYAQGWGPAVDWTDRGQVDEMGKQTCVPLDCYTDVLVIAETSQSEMDAQQLKYYVREVGNVRVGWRGAGEMTKEVLELISFKQLSPEALAEVRAKALALEQSAYQVSRDVYALTSPLEYPEGTPAHAIAITPVAAKATEAKPAEGASAEIVVYAADLPESALSELEVWDDPASPEGKMIGLTNTGDELDPPPESDPHALFTISVQANIPYRCWIHMKVGAPLGVSQANVIWVQFIGAVTASGEAVFNVGTTSYLTAEGPTEPGWHWVECDVADSEAEPLVYFEADGEVTVRLQAGMEGVGFDQIVLSPARFLNDPPTDPIVEK